MIIKYTDFVCQDFLETYMTFNEKLWSKYVDGMKAYVVSDTYLSTLPMMLGSSNKLFNISLDDVPTMVNFIGVGGFWDSLKEGTFYISVNVSHPRQLTWCAF